MEQNIISILENPMGRDWSVQGLGMLRLYLNDHARLHIWSSYLQNNASPIHNHPWDFDSLIISGRVTNIIYKESDPNSEPTHKKQTLFCGEHCYFFDQPQGVNLEVASIKNYYKGMFYRQCAEDIHESIPASGTITIIHRYFKENKDLATIFWGISSKWVSAEPRKATDEEIKIVTEYALERFDPLTA